MEAARPNGAANGWRPSVRVRSRPLTVAAYLAGGIALTATQILRRPAVLDRIWAEDGAVFGREAFGHHLWQSVGRGYSGYLVVLPRVLAAPIVSVVPSTSWGRWFAVSSAAVAACAALAVFRAAPPIVSSTWGRAALAAVLALGPKMRGEWPSIANTAWPLLMALIWMVISTRADTVTLVVRVVVTSLAVLSSAVGLLFAPIVAMVLWQRRRADAAIVRADRIVAAAFAAAGVGQLAGMATAPAGPPGEPWTALGIARLIAIRVFGTIAVGDRAVDDLWFDIGDLLPVASVVIVTGVLIVLARRSTTAARWYAGAAVGLAMMIAVSSLGIRGTARFEVSAGRFVFDADRYFLIPLFLVVSALIILADASQARSVLAPLIAAHLAVVVIGTGLSLPAPGEQGPSWGPAMRRAALECAARPDGTAIDIPIAPAGVFSMNAPCSSLDGAP